MDIDKQLIINAVEVLNKSFEFEGDVFGILHNTAADVLDALEKALEECEVE